MWRTSSLDFPNPYLWRWTIDTKKGTVREEQVDDRPGEFPRVADSRIGLEHRYGYVMGFSNAPDADDPMRGSGVLYKYDRKKGTRTDLDVGRGCAPGEPVFVPAANGKDEDDGYLMTFVHDAAKDSSRFVVYDAKTMDRTPVASIELPRIPNGFHGSWIPASVAN
jgi:carotenoid cleavage dioxygenase